MLMGDLAAATGTGISPEQMAVLAVVVLIAIIAPVLVRRGRSAVPEAKPRPSGGVGPDFDRLRQASDKALVDLLETGREISAQIDTKIRILNKLVKDAEVQAARLEKLLKVSVTVSSAGTVAKVAENVVAARPPAAEPERIVEPAPAAPSAPAPAPSGPTLRPSGRWAADMPRRIAALAAAGRTREEIALAVGLSIQEVDLACRLLSVRSERGEG